MAKNSRCAWRLVIIFPKAFKFVAPLPVIGEWSTRVAACKREIPCWLANVFNLSRVPGPIPRLGTLIIRVNDRLSEGLASRRR